MSSSGCRVCAAPAVAGWVNARFPRFETTSLLTLSYLPDPTGFVLPGAAPARALVYHKC